jgi:hypothetical protein
MNRNILFHVAILLGVLTLAPVLSDPVVDFPAVKLRAYGTVSGAFKSTTTEDRPASLLTVTCDSEEKAKLLQAKYLSDLQLLPGVKAVTIQGREGAIPAYAIEDQGAVLAARDGSKVHILTASTMEDLAKIESGDFIPNRGHLVFAPEVTVPMLLDRFDKYAFQFYYQPWSQPKGSKNYAHDTLQDFDWAQKLDHSGLTIFVGVNRVPTAEGMTDGPSWDFATQAARQREMPVGIESSFEMEAPDWLLNRYRDETAQQMPGYVGGYSDPGFCWPPSGVLSWASTKGEETLLATMQQNIRRMSAMPNVTHFMEPHGETAAITPDVMAEYGTMADASFRAYLQKRYPSIKDLNTAWGTNFGPWSEIRVPELVTFAGYGPQAVDLGGTWRIAYEPTADGQSHTVNELRDLAQQRKLTQNPAPEEWFGEKFDDSAWPALTVPGDNLQALLPQVPAVFRRSFDVPVGWSAKGPKAWLYIWDLARGQKDGDVLRADLNGKTVGKCEVRNNPPHWCVFDVTATVRDGANVLAIRSPYGRINYKVYLTHDEPKAYPDLGPLKNAQWYDFVRWNQEIKIAAMRRGMEMIRQVDPDRGILMMAPHTNAEGMKDLARDYGGDFHDTGGMGGWWHDDLPALMRGAGLPFSTEPGNGPDKPADFQTWYANWITEGVNAIDFFQTLGEVAWNPEIKKYFEDNQQVIKFVGKYHVPFAEVAALYSSHVEELMNFPWSVKGADGNGWIVNRDFLGNGYVNPMEPRCTFRGRYESDGVTESSFFNGDAAKYKVIVDSDTTIMDAATVAAIEKYVRDGGVFIAYGETARHTTAQRDAWSLEHLTGYQVIEPRLHKNFKPQWGTDQKVLSGDLPDNAGGGMRMTKVATDAIDLVRWSDGSVAAGMRPLGKGYIIQWACFGGRPWVGKCFGQIMAWRGVSAIPGHVEPGNALVTPDSGVKLPDIPGQAKMMFRHFISNNGLYDVWTVWNMDKALPLAAEVVVDDASLNPSWAISVKDGLRIPIVKRRFPVKLDPLQLGFYLTPRRYLAHAPVEWFTLQRGWWQGTKTLLNPPLPTPPHKFSVDLTDDWSFQEMGPADKSETLADPNLDDSKWAKVNLGIWDYQGHPDVTHAMLRKHFTVPKEWPQGDVGVWLCTSGGWTFRNLGTTYLDGKPLFDKARCDGFGDLNPGGILQPGTDHVLAIDIDKGLSKLGGTVAGAWLWQWPKPVSVIDLAGTWESSADGLTFDAKAALPGVCNGRAFRWKGIIPAEQTGRRVVIDAILPPDLRCFIVNGHLVAPHGAVRWTVHRFQLDVTPWIQFGKTNQIVMTNERSEATTVEKLNLSFFAEGTYP